MMLWSALRPCRKLKLKRSAMMEVKCEGTGSAGSAAPSSLKVVVPSELQGNSWVQVTIQKEVSGSSIWQHQDDTMTARHQYASPADPLTTPATTSQHSLHWQQVLDAAHNVLYCKELYDRLRKEARQVQFNVPPLVIDKSIYCTLFPGVQLIISLCHNSPADIADTKAASDPQQSSQSAVTRYHVLENCLNQLLCDAHRRATHGPDVTPHPVTGPTHNPVTSPHLTTTAAASHHAALTVHKDTIRELSKQKPLLQQIVEQAKHIVLRTRTFTYLDALAKEFREPSLQIHWNTVNSSTCSVVKVQCVFPFYDSICRTTLELKIGIDGIEIRCKDGRTMNVSYEFNELKDVMLSQIAQHHVMVALAVCRPMSWVVLSNSMTLGCGPLEYVGNASSCVLLSPQRNRCIIIRSGVTTGLKVIIKGVTETDARRLLPPEITFKPCSPRKSGQGEVGQDGTGEGVSGTGVGEECLSIDWTNLVMFPSFPQKLEYLMVVLGQE